MKSAYLLAQATASLARFIVPADQFAPLNHAQNIEDTRGRPELSQSLTDNHHAPWWANLLPSPEWDASLEDLTAGLKHSIDSVLDTDEHLSQILNSASDTAHVLSHTWLGGDNANNPFPLPTSHLFQHPLSHNDDSAHGEDGDDKHSSGNSNAELDEGFTRTFRKGHRTDKTIYELIKESQHTSKFAELVEEYDDIVKLLKDEKAKLTLFVPSNQAFERAKHHKKHKPSREFIEAILHYHLVQGLYPASRVLKTATMPTYLRLPSLGDEPQRLRVGLGLRGLTLNFAARIIPTNIFATNGVLHAVDQFVIPPPSSMDIIQAFPARFSALNLALTVTEVGKVLDPETRKTLFAPTNNAFRQLGPRLNKFLFSEKGKKYLAALLKYHVSIDRALYSDAYYNDKHHDHKYGKFNSTCHGGKSHAHFELPTALEGQDLQVDIHSWFGHPKIIVNHHVMSIESNGVVKDGVIHVIPKLLIPHMRHRKPGDHDDDDKSETEPSSPNGDSEEIGLQYYSDEGQMSVKEFKARLKPYVDHKSSKSHHSWWPADWFKDL